MFLPCITFVALSGTLFIWFLSLAVPVFDTRKVPPITPARCVLSVILPSFIAVYGHKKGSLSFSGAQIGFIVGFIMSVSSYSFMTSVIAFFIAGSAITKWRSAIKKKLEDNFKEGGQRNWLQVICNGGIAAELALLYCIDSGSRELPVDFSKHYTSSWLSTGIIGALACSCGDTFSSEVGIATSVSQPRLITSFRKVPKGTNGAISLNGLIASLFGGFLIGSTFFLTNLACIDTELLKTSPPQWPIIFLGAYAGFAGSLIDSFIGATLQFSGIKKNAGVVVSQPGKDVVHISGTPFFDNHNVNLLSSLLSAILTSLTAYKIFERYSLNV